MDPQARCDALYEALRDGEISRPEYVRQINQIHSAIPAKLRGSVDRRRDERTLGEFALQIYDTTLRERFLVDAWVTDCLDGSYRVQDHGVGNDGRLLLDPRGGSGRPDYRMTDLETDDCWKLEVKFAPSRKFVTFKVGDLDNYIHRRDTIVLVILGDVMIGPNGDSRRDDPLVVPSGLSHFELDAQDLLRVLLKGERGNHRGFGGKATVRVHAADFGRFFDLQPWEAALAVA